VTLLGRFFGSRDDVPEWAKFFPPQDYRAFLGAVDEELSRRGLSYEFGDGTVHVRPDGGEAADYGLLNLAQTCHAAGRSEWSSTIREHFDNAFRSSRDSEELDAKSGSLEAVRPFLKVRLYHTDYLDQMGGVGIVHRVPAEGLIETLVYDLPGSVRTVPPDHVKKWGTETDELFRIGLANVKAEPPPVRQTFDIGKGAVIQALVGDSFFTASHALFLEDHLEPPSRFGALLAVPHRHAVLFHPIEDMKVIGAVNSMIPIAFGMYQEGPGSLSPGLYWWKPPGALTLLPTKVSAQSISFSPPDNFVKEVLNSVPEP